MSHEEKNAYFPVYWLFNSDNPHIPGQCNPLYNPKPQGFFIAQIISK